MKARKVTITLEIETGVSLRTLKDKDWWSTIWEGPDDDPDFRIIQVQVNVIKPSK